MVHTTYCPSVPKKGVISILLSTSCRGNELYFKKISRDKKKEKKTRLLGHLELALIPGENSQESIFRVGWRQKGASS